MSRITTFTKTLCLCLILFAQIAVPTVVVAAEAPAVRILVLARHGHYEADANADPKLGPGLSPLGIAQVQLLGARLAGLPVPFDQMLVSPLTRAQETARVIAADLPRVNRVDVPELAECMPPTRGLEAVAGIPIDEQKVCAARLDKLFAEHFRPASGHERRELLVCHGNVIRYLITKALGVDTKAWLALSVGHTSLTTIRVEADGSFGVIAAGDVGHLPPNLLTGALGDAERKLAVPAAKQ